VGHRVSPARRRLFLPVHIFYSRALGHSRPAPRDRFSVVRQERKRQIVMGRIVLAGLVLALCASLGAPVLAQTDEACMLRCQDHLLYQTCKARCTKGVPPMQAPATSQTPTISRTAPPTTVPPVAMTPPSPLAPPSSAQSATAPSVPIPSALYPAVAQPAPPRSVQPPAQPAANQAPPQPTAQATPQQSVRPSAPPPRPVNEACVLHCLDHGRLERQCDAICAR
jgi:hypothetical protein